jgi:hypothetical protein
MTKAAILIGAVLLLAGVATAGTVTGLGSGGDSPTVSIPEETGSVGDDTVSVPDDTVSVPDRTISTETGEDISGPCDEAEHAGDPRCTGAGQARDDRRGRDDDRRRGRDDRREDRSGPSENSGPGSVNSGRGGNSGPGGGDDD